MKKWRAFLGIGLIVCAAAGLFFWETRGRDAVLTETVLIAAETVPAGTVVGGTEFLPAAISREHVEEGALRPKDADDLKGKVVRQEIPKNGQICEACFWKEEEAVGRGQSIFVLPEEWIAMRSSSLRKGDTVNIFGAENLLPLGTYKVAFVKDHAEQEVVELDGVRQEAALARINGTAAITQVEIIATLQQYQAMRTYCAENAGTLILEQQEEGAKR